MKPLGIPQQFRERVSDDGKRLILAGMRLTAVPDWVRNLTSLTELDLAGNVLTSVPDWLGNLTAITMLDLSSSALIALPESVGNLTALTTLYLSENRLTALPESLGNLTALTTLYLSENRLTALPESLRNLTALTALDLHGNQLTAVPDWSGNLTAHTELGLGENPMADDLRASLTAGTFKPGDLLPSGQEMARLNWELADPKMPDPSDSWPKRVLTWFLADYLPREHSVAVDMVLSFIPIVGDSAEFIFDTIFGASEAAGELRGEPEGLAAAARRLMHIAAVAVVMIAGTSWGSDLAAGHRTMWWPAAILAGCAAIYVFYGVRLGRPLALLAGATLASLAVLAVNTALGGGSGEAAEELLGLAAAWGLAARKARNPRLRRGWRAGFAVLALALALLTLAADSCQYRGAP
jgi:Leucine rich repeat